MANDEESARIAELEAALVICRRDIEGLMSSCDKLETGNAWLEAERDNLKTRSAELEEQIAHQRVWLEQAVIRDYEARIAELEAERDTSRSYVDRVWQALGVLTYEAAGGKAVDELVADLRAERDKLAFALQVIAAGETTDPAAMARAALSDPSGDKP